MNTARKGSYKSVFLSFPRRTRSPEGQIITTHSTTFQATNRGELANSQH